MSIEHQIPLSTKERWFYGGVGALAPIVVAALALDRVVVFENLKLDVVGWWSARCVLLFLVGGFVAFMHRAETDTWRCFVIGISAPALITTALAGKSASNIAQAWLDLPSLVSPAAAQAPDWVVQKAPQVPIATLSSLSEGAGGRFIRGFFGSDPLRAVVVIGSEGNEERAAALAAIAQTYLQCASKDPKNKVLLSSPELKDIPDPVVIGNADEAVAVTLVQFSDARAAASYSQMLRRAGFEPKTLLTTQSRLRDDFSDRFLKGSKDEDGLIISSAEESIDTGKLSRATSKQCAAVGIRP